MGTLFKQRVRKNSRIVLEDLNEVAFLCRELHDSLGLTMDQAIEMYRIAEYSKRTDFLISNGDVFDEQAAGFGELLKELVEQFNNIGGELHNFMKDDGSFQMGVYNLKK